MEAQRLDEGRELLLRRLAVVQPHEAILFGRRQRCIQVRKADKLARLGYEVEPWLGHFLPLRGARALLSGGEYSMNRTVATIQMLRDERFLLTSDSRDAMIRAASAHGSAQDKQGPLR